GGGGGVGGGAGVEERGRLLERDARPAREIGAVVGEDRGGGGGIAERGGGADRGEPEIDVDGGHEQGADLAGERLHARAAHRLDGGPADAAVGAREPLAEGGDHHA